MNFEITDQVRVILPQSALTAIFDECDQFDRDETGGRVIGTFKEHGRKLALHVTGIIGSGPQARRTQVSFFQDGEYQEGIFRQIERDNPEIEHLGNWHTHHVNGLAHLSGGDISTYQRTVNHSNHNTPFFYAMLVVSKNRSKHSPQRYEVKHYILRRDDEHVYEIPARLVDIVDEAVVWPSSHTVLSKSQDHQVPDKFGARPERVYDQDILREFYQSLRPFTSQKLGLYWRGPIELLDGSKLKVVVVEDSSSRVPTYSIVLHEPPDALKSVAEQLANREFPSARAALILTERTCNRALYSKRSRSEI